MKISILWCDYFQSSVEDDNIMWDVLQSQHADKIIVEPLLAEIILIPRLKTGRGLKSRVGLALQTKFWATVGVGDQLTVCNEKLSN